MTDPRLPECLRRAQACESANDVEGALAALAEALALAPALAAAHKNLAALLARSGRTPEARSALERATSVSPDDASLWVRLAAVHLMLGEGDAALAAAGRAEAHAGTDGGAWRAIGETYERLGQWGAAERALERAATLDPASPDTQVHLAMARQEGGDSTAALAGLTRSAGRHPDHLATVVAEKLFLPQVYESAADLGRWRERYARGLSELADDDRLLALAPQVFRLNRHNFLLAYQGEDDRELQRLYSGFLARLAACVHPEWREPMRPTFDGARRLKIGFAGSIFRECTAGRYFERWITGLDPARFERFVYHTGAWIDDFTRRIAATVEHFTPLQAPGDECAARIAADRLDLLVQPEVGMMPLTYLLAALRLAPVQCAGWGHPVTTGSDVVDHFLTCAAMEPPGAATHYVETLLALPGPGVDYAMPPEPERASRAELGLPEGRRLYLCAQSLFKVHPDMDDLVARILAEDGEAIVFFFQSPARRVTEQLAARVGRALAARALAPRGQVKFLPRVSPRDFRRILAAVDVVLDTPHWSGGNTSLDAFSAATPVVALPGRFMRGRQTAALARIMGLGELIADGAEDYARIALDAARDRSRNAALRAAIRRERARIFDRGEPIAALQEVLLAAAAGPGRGV